MILNDVKDGGWSWLVLGVALLSQILVGGLCLTGGIFYVIFREKLHSSAAVTSWLCGLPNALWFFASPVATVLTNQFGYRICSLIGGILATTGLALSFFATDIAFLFVTFGFLGGLGTGIHYTGCLAAVNDYFDKYKTLATGIISVGHNLGQTLYSLLVVYLNIHYGWRGMCLLIGGISFHYCFFAVVLHPFKASQQEDEPPRTYEKKLQIQNRRHAVINWSVLRKSSFLCLCFNGFFINVAESMHLMYLPAYSAIFAQRPSDMAVLLAVFGIANGIGKVVYSICSQHPLVNST